MHSSFKTISSLIPFGVRFLVSSATVLESLPPPQHGHSSVKFWCSCGIVFASACRHDQADLQQDSVCTILCNGSAMDLRLLSSKLAAFWSTVQGGSRTQGACSVSGALALGWRVLATATRQTCSRCLHLYNGAAMVCAPLQRSRHGPSTDTD